VAPVATFQLGVEKIANNRLEIDDAENTDVDMILGIDYFLSHRIYVSRLQGKVYATWNGGPVFARNKGGADDEARYAAAPQSIAPEDADGLARRGQAAASRGDFTRALEDLDRACALAPQAAWNFLARSRVLVSLKQPTKALKDLDEALRLDPSLHDARANRAVLRAGEAATARGALADLQALDTTLPPSSHLRAAMADLYASLDLAPEALHQWDLWMASHRSDAHLASILNQRCWLRARLKFDLPHALDDCKAAMKQDDENADFPDSLGWTYLRLDDPARAIKAFNAAIALRAESPWSYYGPGHGAPTPGRRASRRARSAGGAQAHARIDDEVRKAGFDAAEGSAATPQAAGGAGS
jgi:tetratricopeptide (TPR) repeat protein